MINLSKFFAQMKYMGREECMMVHVHTIVCLTGIVSDCLNLHDCQHYSIAYKMRFFVLHISSLDAFLCFSVPFLLSLFCGSFA